MGIYHLPLVSNLIHLDMLSARDQQREQTYTRPHPCLLFLSILLSVFWKDYTIASAASVCSIHEHVFLFYFSIFSHDTLIPIALMIFPSYLYAIFVFLYSFLLGLPH